MIIETIILVIYSASLLFIFLYALSQLNLLFNYLTAVNTKDNDPKFDLNNPDEVPVVTIQLPVYNELYVMERLLRNIVKMDYPVDKLEIQVLDDSTDESLLYAENLITELQQSGIDIKHITRQNRQGYKAGALKEGLAAAKGDLIAIFDADFVPGEDWLKNTVGYFKDPQLGVVQTKWGHLNRDYSLLTRVQAFALDAHFTLEQIGRNSKGHFINFNGTAGIWRKECILDAGNWEGDTLTEDLDLSYRAQLKQWRFKYLPQVVTPAELPVTISAARSQQFRWNKGGAENFQKFKSRLLLSPYPKKRTKLHGLLHLLNSTMFLNILVVAVLSIPILYIKNEYAHLRTYFLTMSFFIISTLIFFISYWFTFRKPQQQGFIGFIKYTALFFTFFSIAMGFSLQNSIAVLQGHMGKKSEFVRTPKFNLNLPNKSVNSNKYLTNTLSVTIILEGILMLYFAFGIYSAFVVGNQGGDFGLFPFHLMLFLGFGYVFLTSLWWSVRKR